MLTPAQRHFQRVMAERHGNADPMATEARTAHEQILHQLRMDQSELKRVQSSVAKGAMKKNLLPRYEGWIDGTLEGNSGRQDEVITTLMIWAIDAEDYAQALRIGRYVVTHGLIMPDRFERSAPTVLTEEISDPVLNRASVDPDADLSDCAAMLEELAQIVDGQDMPDEVRAKLCKARAFSLRKGDTEAQGQALKLLQEAMTLNPAAGVKKEIQSLNRLLKKAGDDNASAAGEDKTNVSAEAQTDPAVSAMNETSTAGQADPTVLDENKAAEKKTKPAADKKAAKPRKKTTAKKPGSSAAKKNK